MDFEDSPKQLMDEAVDLLNDAFKEKSIFKKAAKSIVSSMKDNQDIINKIASEFPYRIDEVAGVYYKNDCSEEKTRDALMKELKEGDLNE